MTVVLLVVDAHAIGFGFGGGGANGSGAMGLILISGGAAVLSSGVAPPFSRLCRRAAIMATCSASVEVGAFRGFVCGGKTSSMCFLPGSSRGMSLIELLARAFRLAAMARISLLSDELLSLPIVGCGGRGAVLLSLS